MLQLKSRVNWTLSTLKVGATIQNEGDLKMKKKRTQMVALVLVLGVLLGVEVSLAFYALHCYDDAMELSNLVAFFANCDGSLPAMMLISFEERLAESINLIARCSFAASVLGAIGALSGFMLVWRADDCVECEDDEDEDEEDKQYSLSTRRIDDDVPHPDDENDSHEEDDEIESI